MISVGDRRRPVMCRMCWSSILPLLLPLVLFTLIIDVHVDALSLPGTQSAHARFPPWAGCMNASFAFDFRTTQSIPENGVLLWYADDGGRTDFFVVMLTAQRGAVRLVLRLADEVDGNVDISLGQGVNDGRWHRVEVRRKRAETFLVVDDDEESGVVFGHSFHFGRGNNSDVFVGGIPPEFVHQLSSLAMPSAVFAARFQGSVRNVVYGNCTCERRRAREIGGVGVRAADDACELRNPCRDGCLCISSDVDTSCDCSDLVACVTGQSFFLELLYSYSLSSKHFSSSYWCLPSPVFYAMYAVLLCVVCKQACDDNVTLVTKKIRNFRFCYTNLLLLL